MCTESCSPLNELPSGWVEPLPATTTRGRRGQFAGTEGSLINDRTGEGRAEAAHQSVRRNSST